MDCGSALKADKSNARIQMFLLLLVFGGSSDGCKESDDSASAKSEDYINITIWARGWQNVVDADGDGYARSKQLYIDFWGSYSGTTCYAKFYYRPVGREYWDVYLTTSAIPATNESPYILTVGYPNFELPHGEYDFMIESYVAGSNRVSSEQSRDAKLLRQKLERSSED